jgi:Nucleotide modification associated domain 1
MNTSQQYDTAVAACKDIFIKKTIDYGTSWRVYRTISVVDQIYIKAKRIRAIQEKGNQKIGDDINSEFKGIMNYAVIGLMQLDLEQDTFEEMSVAAVDALYTQKVQLAKALMQNKNHDYDEAWRDMSQESFTDLILAKLLRIKSILKNNGVTIISEGIDANYLDIINYALFNLILY